MKYFLFKYMLVLIWPSVALGQQNEYYCELPKAMPLMSDPQGTHIKCYNNTETRLVYMHLQQVEPKVLEVIVQHTSFPQGRKIFRFPNTERLKANQLGRIHTFLTARLIQTQNIDKNHPGEYTIQPAGMLINPEQEVSVLSRGEAMLAPLQITQKKISGYFSINSSRYTRERYDGNLSSPGPLSLYPFPTPAAC